MKNWINVSESLPEPYVTVLILAETWLFPVAAFRFDPDHNVEPFKNSDELWMLSGKYEEDYDNMKFFGEKVICWMPIPER